MKTFKSHLNEKLKDTVFREMYEEERQLLELSMKIIEERKKAGFTQKELAQNANITQQQLSKIENGVNCNMHTFLKVCHALGIKVDLKGKEYKAVS